MNPTVKKLLAAVAIKEGIERFQELRNPKKPSLIARLGKLALIAGVGGGLYHAYKTGRIHALMGKQRPSDDYSSSWDAGSSQVRTSVPSDSTAPSEQPVGTPS